MGCCVARGACAADRSALKEDPPLEPAGGDGAPGGEPAGGDGAPGGEAGEQQPHMPVLQEVEYDTVEKYNQWQRLGGFELSSVLTSGAALLLDAEWMVQQAESSGILKPRQALPPAAFQSYSGVLAGTPACSTPVPKLHVVCVSHCWLQADHPDPRGHNLRILARALRLLDAHVYGPRPQRMGRWAVFMDLCCIHQNCRDSKGVPQQRTYQRLEGSDKFADGAIGRFDSENVLFKEALGSLGSFYSHPCTYVFMLTKFPEDYQTAAYTHSADTEQYFNRGWCYCESSWAVLTKPSDLTLNLGLSTGDEISYSKLVEVCSAERKPPVFPDAFEVELQRKAFTNGKDDRPRVAELYRDAFAQRLKYSQRLSFRNLQWDAEHMKQLVTALAASGGGPNLQLLDLCGNRAGDEGVALLVEALRAPGAFPKLRELNLRENQIGAAGAAHLAEGAPGVGHAAQAGDSAPRREWDRERGRVAPEECAACAGGRAEAAEADASGQHDRKTNEDRAERMRPGSTAGQVVIPVAIRRLGLTRTGSTCIRSRERGESVFAAHSLQACTNQIFRGF
ncbi:unnamed protein product [Prorocentrum cordatum]|uniref:Uncharacterized protein n=1 Tax=Prorocentrum cordatum TaxID=2364126 RepID=A0ABN9QLL6_9DINO|nr:unnamed protein product [Polarella glacialis]